MHHLVPGPIIHPAWLSGGSEVLPKQTAEVTTEQASSWGERTSDALQFWRPRSEIVGDPGSKNRIKITICGLVSCFQRSTSNKSDEHLAGEGSASDTTHGGPPGWAFMGGQSFTPIRTVANPSHDVDTNTPSTVLTVSYCWISDAAPLDYLVTPEHDVLKELVLRRNMGDPTTCEYLQVHFPGMYVKDWNRDVHAMDED
ncbi:hypothetical protein EDC04DRAFT_2888914 [Pisolithus marmoratus]|nr:hypothetical protein EDC04DRAFT_2888914 [Pisolithus marmoratus]